MKINNIKVRDYIDELDGSVEGCKLIVKFVDGYGLYEISNFAKAGRECQHNLCYWRGENYAGYGPGAVGCVPVVVDGQCERMRTTNLKHPERYCEAVERGAVVYFEHEILTDEVQEMERIMLGLRLTEGLTVESPNLGKLVVRV